jgi:hypothetical protein
MDAMQAEVASVLERWREITAPLDHARVEKGAQLSATPIRDLLASRPAVSPPRENSSSCRAWSHADFLDRVASFGVATWFAKPLCISPLACARFGWRNTATDLLQCAQCERVLCFRIDLKLSQQGAEAVAARFAGQLESAHGETCPWSHNASPESFTMVRFCSSSEWLEGEERFDKDHYCRLQLPLLGPSQVAHALWERIEALLLQASKRSEHKQALLEMRVDQEAVTTLLDGSGLNETTLIQAVTKRLVPPHDFNTQTILHAAVLSACGWTLQNQSEKDITMAVVMSCAFCNRHVPLQPNPMDTVSEETKEDTDEAPPAKRQRVTQEKTTPPPMNPIAQHRSFCPVVVAQRHRDPLDETRLRDTMALVSGPQGRGEKDSESLADFIVLPGWKQSALVRVLNRLLVLFYNPPH